jgi:putative Ca2+/H+ antiporter (TMEM165/GDT1 family)
MSFPSAVAFAEIAATLFLAELTDKDALLLLALATRTRASKVFLAGATAFLFTTAVIVTVGAIAIAVVPIQWVKLAGGVVMVGYGLWEARGLVGQKAVEDEEEMIESSRGGLRSFLLMVGALAFLDLAGDATEVLTVVFVAQYSDALFVFAAAYAGLLGATAVETALGNRLGRLLTPGRLRYLSVFVFLLLGALILVSSL